MLASLSTKFHVTWRKLTVPPTSLASLLENPCSPWYCDWTLSPLITVLSAHRVCVLRYSCYFSWHYQRIHIHTRGTEQNTWRRFTFTTSSHSSCCFATVFNYSVPPTSWTKTNVSLRDRVRVNIWVNIWANSNCHRIVQVAGIDIVLPRPAYRRTGSRGSTCSWP